MIRRIAIIGALVATFLATPSGAQTVVEDANGRSTYILPDGGPLLGINTAASSAEFGYFDFVSGKPYFGGASLSVASKEGVGPIFGKGDVRPGVAVEIVLGLKKVYPDPGEAPGTGQAGPARGRKPAIAGGLRARRTWSEIAIVNPADAESPIDTDVRFAWDVGGYGYFMPNVRGLFSDFVVALGAGRRTLDNYADLTKVAVQTTTQTTTADGRLVEVTTTEEARRGVYLRQHHMFVDIDMTKRIADGVSVRAFGRFFPGRDEGSVAKNAGGVDIGIFRNDPVLGRLVGFVAQVNENLPGAPRKEFSDRLTLSVVVNVIPVARALLK